MTDPAPSAQPSGSPPQANLVDVINAIAEKADPIIKLVVPMIEKYQKGQEREIKFQIHMAWVAVSVVILVVGVAAFLTFRGKIDGSTFTFLLGLIVGYVLTFVRDQVTGPEK
jgi:hypothetical protein